MRSRLSLPMVGFLVLPLLAGFVLVRILWPAAAHAGEEGENTGGGSRSNSASMGVIHRPAPLDRSNVPPPEDEGSKMQPQTGLRQEAAPSSLLRTVHKVFAPLWARLKA